MLLSSSRRPRPAFTLLELMVVILIVVLLAGLLLSAVTKVLIYTDEVRTVSEIGQLSQALEAFRLEFGLYPPSSIILIENGAYDRAIPAQAYSASYLERMFPGIDLTAGHDWNGNGISDPPYALEGHEALVLFLGGPPYASLNRAPGGWHTDKTAPTRPPTPTATRLGPFYEFNVGKLVAWNPAKHLWGGYADPYGTPYAYFLARDTSFNNYTNDCSSLVGSHFVPYFTSASGTAPNLIIKYHRPDKFQLISAGRDRLFGIGGHYDPSNPQNSQWNPAAGSLADRGRPGNPSSPDRVQDDYDNITNFTEGKMVP
jgi:prepilin-type N-terminal cleavage/methylation domain-containing protein